MQELTLNVPSNRLHLVNVDAKGVARLKLRPRYETDGEQHVVQVDVPPTYDSQPDIEELFREATRNHQLERAHETERRSAKAKRREAHAERRAELAKVFLTDPAQRALVHPAPTPKRCWLGTSHGRVVFDANTDVGAAHDLPAEAHRRFRADLRSRREENLKTRAEHLALHDEKKAFIAEWIAGNGTADQQVRQRAGARGRDIIGAAGALREFGELPLWALPIHGVFVPNDERIAVVVERVATRHLGLKEASREFQEAMANVEVFDRRDAIESAHNQIVGPQSDSERHRGGVFLRRSGIRHHDDDRVVSPLDHFTVT